MNFDPSVLIVIAIGIIVVIVLGRIFIRSAKKHGENLTEKDLAQMKVDNIARGTDEERWHNVGKSAKSSAKGKGCIGKVILIGIIIIVLLALFDAFIGNGEILKSILGN